MKVRNPGILMRIRYRLLIWLAGDMPVVMNMIISRPLKYEGPLVKFRRFDRPGIVCGCVMLGKQWTEGILAAKRDHNWETWI